MARSDEDLLASAREGDRAALEELLQRHQHRVFRFGIKMCGEEEDAKDVLQETLIAAARGIRDFRGASSVSTWLYTIARSFCIKRHRTSKFAPTEASIDAAAPEAQAIPDPRRGPEEAAVSAQVRAALKRAIGSLEPMYREVLVLRDVEGLSAGEVADVLGVSVDAVKSRLHRGRVAVRQQLAPVLGTPEVEDPALPEGLCPDVLALFSRHLEGEISGSICTRLEEHLQACERCRSRCDSLRATLTLCSQSGEEVPPRVEQSVRAALRKVIDGAA